MAERQARRLASKIAEYFDHADDQEFIDNATLDISNIVSEERNEAIRECLEIVRATHPDSQGSLSIVIEAKIRALLPDPPEDEKP